MSEAKYIEIANRLRGQIDSGAFKPGERLPSEPDLVREFEASRNTVRLALALLTNQGLVVTRQGLGSYVAEQAKPFTALLSRVATHHVVQNSTTALPEVGNAHTPPETSRYLVETAPASPSVAEKLEILAGETVVVRRRQAMIGTVPWLMMATYYPMDIAAGSALEQAGEIPGGSLRLLATLGHPQVGFIDEIGARMPSSQEFAFFGLSTGTPVIVVNRTAYSPDRPIRMTRYIYRADRVRLAHEVGIVPSSVTTEAAHA